MECGRPPLLSGQLWRGSGARACSCRLRVASCVGRRRDARSGAELRSGDSAFRRAIDCSCAAGGGDARAVRR